MKIILALILMISGCAQTKHASAHRTPSKKAKTLQTDPHTQTVEQPNVLGTDKKGNIRVDGNWMKDYLRMERGTKIPADAKIWEDGDSYWVSDAVAAHYSKMKIEENAPKQ